MTERDERLLEQSVIEVLTGTQVSVQGLTKFMEPFAADRWTVRYAEPITKFMEPLTQEGAQQVVDKLRARGFKVVRVV